MVSVWYSVISFLCGHCSLQKLYNSLEFMNNATLHKPEMLSQ